jgi:hypothetical protein
LVISDLKIGMYLNCDGPASLPIYTDLECTDLLINIAPGQEIGQIHDIQNNASGNVVIFASDAITKAYPWYDKLMGEGITAVKSIVNPISFWTDDTDKFSNWGVYGVAKFSDIQAYVTDKQLASQNAVIQATADNGASLTTTVKKVFSATGEDFGTAISGFIGGAAEGGGSLLWTALLLFVGYKLVTNTSLKTKGFTYSYYHKPQQRQSKSKRGFSFKY